MFIYKITNIKNGKMYIGQTIRPVMERWKRHCNDALNNILDTHFARAIRYYTPNAFTVEIIDTATSQQELTAKESYWIAWYDSTNKGYNETSATSKCGGNTYQKKSIEELQNIKNKISKSNMGLKNPHATSVKCKNIRTNEEYHFPTQKAMQDFFQESNHQFISRRCLHKTVSPYKKEWIIAYENDEYYTK